MAAHTTARRMMALASALCLCGAATGGGPPGQRVSLQPGMGIVESRERGDLRLRLDRGVKIFPAQIQGLTVVLRRLVRTVYVPQSWQPFAEEWEENGSAIVLPVHTTGGDLVARLVSEDEEHPVKAGDRVELCRVPAEALRPVLVSLRCVGREGEAPAVAPGEMVCLQADVFSATDAPAACAWACDAGQFLHPGGLPAGRELAGAPVVRWRAPAPAPATGKATVRVTLTAGPRAQPAEGSLTLRLVAASKPYARTRWARTRVPGLGKGALGPLVGEAGHVAAGPPGAFFLVDAPNKRLLHWRDGTARYVALGGEPVGALASFGGSAYLLQGDAVRCLKPGAAALAALAPLPGGTRRVGLGVNAAGDLYLLDSGAPPTLHVRADGAAWGAVALEPRVDSPWLQAFCVDAGSNDVYVLDTRDRMIRRWRAVHGGSYRLLDVAIAVGKIIDKHGPPVAMVPRRGCHPLRDVPVQLVFKDGTLTDKWAAAGKPPRWEPTTSPQPRDLVRLGFAAARAALLPSGDVLLAGQTTAGSAGPAVVQLSARGGFRRMLPLPELPPRFVAAAPDGRRYVVLARRRGRTGGERLIAIGPQGWMLRDFGTLDAYRSIAGLRPDRGSSDHVLLIADRQRRDSVFRFDASDPSRCLELSSAGLPGRRIPEHEAVDAASSADRIAVLDADGKVLLFSNSKPVSYLTAFETDLRSPKAIAVLSAVPGDGGTHAYICVLSSAKAASIHLWEVRTADAGKQVVERVGEFPDPERSTAGVGLAAPVAMDSAFPDQPGRLYVLERGGTQLRAFDVGAIAGKLRKKLPPAIEAAPVMAKLPFEDHPVGLSIGAGQVVHIADEDGDGIHTYARRP